MVGVGITFHGDDGLMEASLVRPIYKDFLKFLAAIEGGEEPWGAFWRLYLVPNGKVFVRYWRSVHWLPLSALRERVRRVRPQHYGLLRALEQISDLPGLATEGLKRAKEILPMPFSPEVYLMVGFFSPDGMVLEMDRRPSILVGMERLRVASDVALIVAHEYGHVGRMLIGPEEERTLLFCVVSEGLSSMLVRLAFPEAVFPRPLLFDRRRWNELLACEREAMAFLEQNAFSTDRGLILSFLDSGGPGGRFPPRVGRFVGYRLVEEFLERRGASLREAFPLSSGEFLPLVCRGGKRGYKFPQTPKKGG